MHHGLLGFFLQVCTAVLLEPLLRQQRGNLHFADGHSEGACRLFFEVMCFVNYDYITLRQQVTLQDGIE